MDVELYFDGASKGNGGPSGAGYWVKCEDSSYGGYKFLGNATNNVAEYNGLILGLKNLGKYREHQIKVYGDSKLVICQMNRIWKVKAEHLILLWNEAQELIKDFKDISFIHIDRSLNSKADLLANLAIRSKTPTLTLMEGGPITTL